MNMNELQSNVVVAGNNNWCNRDFDLTYDFKQAMVIKIIRY